MAQLPLTKGLVTTLAAPGLGVVAAVVPAPALGPVTKNAATNDEMEGDSEVHSDLYSIRSLTVTVTDAVVGAMQELRVATVARNLEVQEEVDNVRNRRSAASAFLDAEVRERDSQLEAMKVQY